MPLPTYPLYTAVLAKIGGAAARTTEPIRDRDWLPDLDHMRSLVTPTHARAGRDRPQQSHRRRVSRGDAPSARGFAEEHGLTILADEVYGDLGFDGPVPLLGRSIRTRRSSRTSSLSKAYLAPGWRAGWMVVGATPRLDGALAAIKKLADGRLCSPGPDAVRGRRRADRRPLAPGAASVAPSSSGRASRRSMLNAIPGIRCVEPRAAFYALPSVALPPGRTDEEYVLGAAAGDRHPLRPRLRLRHAARTGLLPHRLPRRARRAADDLRGHRAFTRDYLNARVKAAAIHATGHGDTENMRRYLVLCVSVFQ